MQEGMILLRFKGSEVPEAYIGYIFSNWLRSLRYGVDYFKWSTPSIYYKMFQTRIKWIMERPECHVTVAVLADDKDVLLGFSCDRGPDILDYVFVHRDYRKNGIGKLLVGDPPKTVTHMTKTGHLIAKSKMKGVEFNPFI